MMRVQLACPVYGAIDVDTVVSLLPTIDALRAAGRDVSPPGFARRLPHTFARGMILREFVRGGADALVSFDSGVSWRASDVLAALDAIEHHGADVLAFPVAEDSGAVNVYLDPSAYTSKRLRGLQLGEHAWIVGKHLAGGALHVVSRRAALRLIEAHPEAMSKEGVPVGLFTMGIRDGHAMTEDCSFFAAWTSIGETWVQISARVRHDRAVAAYDDDLRAWGYAIEWPDGTVTAADAAQARELRFARAAAAEAQDRMSVDRRMDRLRPRASVIGGT